LRSHLRFQVLVFTVTRTVLNSLHRMVYPFLTVIGSGLGVDFAALSFGLTLRSLAGAAGPFLASIADSRGRKTGMLFGLLLFSLGAAAVVIWPTYPGFLIALVLGVVGKYVFDPSMQAYLGDRVSYARRGRVIAVTELGWSLSFVLGVPLVGLLIARYGWYAPFPFFFAAGLLAMGVIAWMLPRDRGRAAGQPGLKENLAQVLKHSPALYGLGMGLAVSAANEVVNVVFGAWLEGAFGLKIAALSATALVIGFAELGGETFSATLTDRLGKPRSIGLGLILNSLAALALPFLGASPISAAVGLFFFYITFEFALVSSIPLMTEVFSPARATLMAGNVASHSLGRALGASLAAPLFILGQASPRIPDILLCGLAAIVLNLLGLVLLARLDHSLVRRRAAEQA
jgi:predicted MFS family arabinose efflux permease